MATATDIRVVRSGRCQFRGLFSDIVVVQATVPEVTISGNSNEETIIAAPGIQHDTDFVLGWTHSHAGTHAHEVTESFHTWDDELHLTAHNSSGAPVVIPITAYRIIVGRLVSDLT